METDLLEIFLHDGTDLVQECEQHCNVAVLPGRGDYVEVAVLDVGKGALIRLNQWPLVRALIIFHVSHQTCIFVLLSYFFTT